LLGRTDQWREHGVFTNRHFNLVYVLAMVILFALLWIPALTWLSGRESISLPIEVVGYRGTFRIALHYYLAVTAPSLVLCLFALFYAPVGLVRNAGGRIVHLLQLVAALLLLASLAACAVLVLITMANPG